ncbi:MAG TPA: hypothetical protein VFF78_01460 [Anaerolineaceae bacterium]|nr:hypothetical protein [Anaerolineaceae bacterium]
MVAWDCLRSKAEQLMIPGIKEQMDAFDISAGGAASPNVSGVVADLGYFLSYAKPVIAIGTIKEPKLYPPLMLEKIFTISESLTKTSRLSIILPLIAARLTSASGMFRPANKSLSGTGAVNLTWIDLRFPGI